MVALGGAHDVHVSVLIDGGDIGVGRLHAVLSGLLVHGVGQVEAVDGIEAGIVLHVAGEGDLAAGDFALKE